MQVFVYYYSDSDHNSSYVFDVLIVHTHLFVASFFGKIAAKIAGVNAILSTEHNTSSFESRPWFYILALKFSLKLTKKVIAVSKRVKKSVVKIGNVLPEKVVVVYNGVDLGVFNPSIYNKKDDKVNLIGNTKSDFFIIGSIGRLDPRKGFEYLIDAIPKVKATLQNVKFFIAGDGEQLGKLKRKLNSKDLTFLEAKTPIAKFLSAIDIFVLPSVEEGLGLSILEAMAMGKPVIATKTGGVPEIVKHKETGYLVPPKNSDALAKAIIKMLRNHKDRNNLARKGRELIEQKFALNQMIIKIEAIYANLANSKF